MRDAPLPIAAIDAVHIVGLVSGVATLFCETSTVPCADMMSVLQ